MISVSDILNRNYQKVYSTLIFPFETKIKLIETFKKNQFSQIVAAINLQIIHFLNSDYVSNEVAVYFKECSIEKLPFSDFNSEPDNITQLKKLMNALYHIRLALIDLESIDLRQARLSEHLQLLFSNTIEHAYEAVFSITHLDINLKNIFQEEIVFILPYLTQLQNCASNQFQTLSTVANQIHSYMEPIGAICGKTIEQMRPFNVEKDFGFLTDVTSKLPKKIAEISSAINSLLPESAYNTAASVLKDLSLIEKNEFDTQPRLNQEKIYELQKAAFDLQQNIKLVKHNNIFSSFQIIHYIYIVRHIITLAQSIIEEMESLSDTSQNFIIDHINQLKYQLILPFIQLIDKNEIHGLLKPGCLSVPIMLEINHFFQKLIFYPLKTINFAVKSSDILVIEDTKFFHLRINEASRRITNDFQQIFIAQQASKSLVLFIKQLDKEELRSTNVVQLSNIIKNKLQKFYPFFKDFSKQLDTEFDQLLKSTISGCFSSSNNFLRSFDASNWAAVETIPSILSKCTRLLEFIEKSINTQKFYIDQNQSLIKNLLLQPRKEIFPYNENNPVKCSDEFQTLIYRKADRALAAARLFYNALEQEEFNNLQLHKLPAAVTTILEEYYPVLAEYVSKINPFVHEIFTKYALFIEKSTIQKPKDNPFRLIKTADLLQIRKSLENEILNSRKISASFLVEHFPLSKMHDSIIYFQNSEYGNLVKNPESLNAAQTIDLLSLYQQQKFYYQSLLNGCTDLLHLINSPEIHENKREELRRNYHFIQPHFYEILTSESIHLDKQFIDFINDENSTGMTDDFIKKLSFLRDKNNLRLDLIQDTVQSLFQLAENKYQAELLSTKLVESSVRNKRADFLLADHSLSESINKFRTDISHYLDRFNENFQNNVSLNKNCLPFPEIEEGSNYLKEPEQVRAIKALYNGLYHFEQIAKHLEFIKKEKLFKKNSTLIDKGLAKLERIYFVYEQLQNAYSHLNEILSIGKHLVSDPYVHLILNEFYQHMQFSLSNIESATTLYSISAQQVKPHVNIEFNSLWYALNAFFIFPEHLRSIANKHFMSQQFINLAEIRALKTNITIEKIIESSDSYVKLFLQTPKMFILYQRLKRQFYQLCTTSHDYTFANIKKINKDVFVPMLIAADKFEVLSNISALAVSEPLEKIIYQFLQGLLSGMSLDLKMHRSILYNPHNLDKRLASNQLSIKSCVEDLGKLKNYYLPLKNLFHKVENYFAISNYIFNSQELENDIKKTFLEAYTLLYELQKNPQILLFIEKINSTPNFDALCNQQLNESMHKISNIYNLIQASMNYYQGLCATKKMTIQTLCDKRLELIRKKDALDCNKNKFTKKFINIIYNTQVNHILAKEKNFYIINEEYLDLLTYQLKHQQSRISMSALAVEDPHDFILAELEILKSNLKATFHAKYQLLDRILIHLEQLKLTYVHAKSSDIKSKKIDFCNELIMVLSPDISRNLELIYPSLGKNKREQIDKHVKLILQQKFNIHYNENDCLIPLLNNLKETLSANQYLEINITINNVLKKYPKLQAKFMVVKEKEIAERLKLIKDKIESPICADIMSSHCPTQKLSWDYLKYLLCKVLEFLGMYTFPDTQIYLDLKKDVSQISKQKEPSKVGFFALKKPITKNHSFLINPLKSGFQQS